jgi:hypothetical protein
MMCCFKEIIPGQVWARFYVFEVKIGVNGGEGVEFLEPD